MLSMGLARAATRRAIAVQTFKKGPDYIDPLWLKAASFKPSYNLDPYLQSDAELLSTYQQHMSQMMLVEGTMGLHDGLMVDGSDSNAAIAKQLGLPVLLVIDCPGMHRTIASLVNGIVQFDSDVAFSGLVLNRIRSTRHASKIENAIKEYCDIPLMGVVPECSELQIDERELGLVPAPDHPKASDHIDTVADLLETACDLDSLLETNRIHQSREAFTIQDLGKRDTSGTHFRVAIAQDEAFHFYYADDLECLASRGVTLVPFSPMHDSFPADIDGVLIGGGFPERHAAALADNKHCRDALANAITQGLPVRAECGGLMYLCQSIEIDNVVWPMVGTINGAVSMHAKPQGRGYMKLMHNQATVNEQCSSEVLAAHEFHHSQIHFDSPAKFAYQVTRGHGVDSKHDGVCVHNVIASYAHFRHTQNTPWIDWFLEAIQRSKQDALKTMSHV